MISSVHAPFVLFGTDHALAMLTIALICATLPAAVRFAASETTARAVGGVVGAALLAQEIAQIGLRVFAYDEPLLQNLPLHLCGVATFLVAFMLLRRSYAAFEVAYFWGLGGALQAIVTPDLSDAFPSPLYLAFFISHGLLILGVVYAAVVYRFRPTLQSVFKAIGITFAYAALMLPVNLVLGTNYLYLSRKPEHASLIDYLGAWPWYVPALIAIGVLSCIVCYMPFGVAAYVSSRRTRRVW